MPFPLIDSHGRRKLHSAKGQPQDPTAISHFTASAILSTASSTRLSTFGPSLHQPLSIQLHLAEYSYIIQGVYEPCHLAIEKTIRSVRIDRLRHEELAELRTPTLFAVCPPVMSAA